ncbi:hypothetical protein PCC79_06700 [Propioniciclava soli]|uniref:Uncharacterized protein n=1 Tax=Propioniciclava soli TaxID=2775081 RepID=A0ABZ3CAS7_9ACTN
MALRSARRPLFGVLAAALAASVCLVAPAHAAENPLPASYTAPPAPGGALTDLGSPISSLTVVEGDFGHLPDGTFVAYAAPMGEDAALNVSTATSGTNTLLGQYPMVGASGAPMVQVAPDGRVYAATYTDGHLYRWDPATAEMTDLGQAPGGATYLYGLSFAPDGTVYGGSYPHATVWSYADGVGFTDLQVPIPDASVQYTRTVYDPDRHALWIGTQATAHLYRFDLTTGALAEVTLAAAPKAVSSVSDLDYAEGRVFVNWGGYVRVVDAESLTEVAFTDVSASIPFTAYPLSARGVSEAKQGGVYFSSTQVVNGRNSVEVVRYDLATDTVARTGANTTVRGALIGYGWTVENGQDVLYALAGNYSGGGFMLNIDSGRWQRVQYDIPRVPSPLQHVLPNADGSQVLVNAFLNGDTSRWDVARGTATPFTRFGQVEDWTLVDGVVHAGVYPNGTLVSAPFSSSSSPTLTTHATLKDSHQQIRPIEAKEHEGRIWYGTNPDYGLHGGAIAVLDPTTGAVDVTVDVVPDHTIAALAFVGSRVFAGSSTVGGTGTQPVPGSGTLIAWDAATKSVVASVTPVEGARSVNALVEHHGLLYGLADHTLFEADPDTLAVTRTLHLGTSGPVQPGEGELVFHPNGYLYASVDDAVVVVDPLAFVATTLLGEGTQRWELSPDGSFWTTVRPEGARSFTHLGQYGPAATDCAAPDTRPYVTLLGRTTTVRNRFLTTGCTLQDLIPTQGVPPRRYEAVLQPWLSARVAAGQLSPIERRLLWDAARGR